LGQITIKVLQKLTSVTVTAATCALVLAGSSLAAPKYNSVSALLNKTGITQQVQSLKDLITESSNANAIRCSSQPHDQQLPSFNAQSIIVDIELIFAQINSTSLAPIYSWYQSPVAEKISIAEKQIVENANLRDFLQTARYKDPTRKTYIQNIVRNTYTAEFVATLATEIEYAGIVHSGCIEKAAVSGKANREQMLADITRNDKDLTATLLMSDITAETAYLFRNLSTDELSLYETYTSSDNARQFYQNLIDAVQQALKLAGDGISLTQNNSQAAAEQ